MALKPTGMQLRNVLRVGACLSVVLVAGCSAGDSLPADAGPEVAPDAGNPGGIADGGEIADGGAGQPCMSNLVDVSVATVSMLCCLEGTSSPLEDEFCAMLSQESTSSCAVDSDCLLVWDDDVAAFYGDGDTPLFGHSCPGAGIGYYPVNTSSADLVQAFLNRWASDECTLLRETSSGVWDACPPWAAACRTGRCVAVGEPGNTNPDFCVEPDAGL